MARRVMRRRSRPRRRGADNPRGYIRYRGRWIASAPYHAHGRVVGRKRRRRYASNPRRLRRRRRHSNPWVSGFSYRRKGFRVPGGRVRVGRHFRRGRRRHADDNPPRRRLRRRRRYSVNPRRSYRRRRRYSNNPVHYGGGRRMTRLLDNPLEAIKSVIEEAFSGDTIETILHTGVGFGATLVGAKQVYKNLIPALDTKVGHVVSALGTSILGSGIVGMLTKDSKLTTRFLIGGLMGTLWQGVSEAARDTKAAEFLPLLGEAPETEEFRKAIEKEVLKELRGGGMSEAEGEESEEGMSIYLQPAGVQEAYLTPAGTETYLTQSETERTIDRGMSAYLTESEGGRAAGVMDYDEFASTGMPERF